MSKDKREKMIPAECVSIHGPCAIFKVPNATHFVRVGSGVAFFDSLEDADEWAKERRLTILEDKINGIGRGDSFE